MQRLSPAQYMAEMRQIEGRRNAATRQGERRAVEVLVIQSANLSRRFFGRGRS
jgi:hypothetical protein